MAFKFNPLTGRLEVVSIASGFATAAFTTIQADAGTSPVASGTADTLTFTSPQILVTGDSGTDTITLDIGALDIGDGGTTNYAAIDATGKIIFNGSAGLAYGSLSVSGNASYTTITTLGVKVQFLGFDTNGTAKNVTPDHTNDHITINNDGDYEVICAITTEAELGGYEGQYEIYKNNGATLVGNLSKPKDWHWDGDDQEELTLYDIVTLSANDTLELWLTTNNGTGNILVSDCVFSVKQIGG